MKSRLTWNAVLLLLLFAHGIMGAAAVVQADPPQAPRKNSAIEPPLRVDGVWGERHQAINDLVQKGNVDLMFLGDSIMNGWNFAGKDVWQHYYAGRKAVRAGIGGDQTQHVLWRLKNGHLAGISPKLVVLMIGTNNSGHNTSEETAAGVAAIVDYLQEKSPSTHILLLGIFPRGTPDDRFRRVNEGVNAIIAKLGEREGVTYKDIGHLFLDAEGRLPREMSNDQLHLTPLGYAKWAEAIEPEVSRILNDTPIPPAKR